MNNMDKKQALHYHAMGRPGKIEVVPTKPHSTNMIFHWPILQG